MTHQPRFFVTGASGQLGRHVIAALVARAGAQSVVALVRDPAKAAPLFPEGVTIRQADYNRPETLDAALAGAERLLLISSSEVGARISQHRAVIDAAKRAGVARIAYTSVLRADGSELSLAEDHRQTEALIAASGLPHTLLRNGWYTENYTAAIPATLAHGALIGGSGDGRVAAATRADYAEAAAIALLDDAAPAHVVYELAGDRSFSLPEFAAELSRQSGRDIPYVNLDKAAHVATLVQAGLPEGLAVILADCDAITARGGLFDESHELSRLLGRPTTPWEETVEATLAALSPA